MGDDAKAKAFALSNQLRRAGVSCDLDHMDRGIKSQFKYADKIGAKFVGVIGSSELEAGVIKIKDMSTGEEKEVKFDDLVNYIK
jgi:histidyl-tRNA synthetase